MRVANKEAQQFAQLMTTGCTFCPIPKSAKKKKQIAEEGKDVAHADELFISDLLGYLYVRGNQGQNFKKSFAYSICYNSAKETTVQKA